MLAEHPACILESDCVTVRVHHLADTLPNRMVINGGAANEHHFALRHSLPQLIRRMHRVHSVCTKYAAYTHKICTELSDGKDGGVINFH